jgi:23S rRNA pseudouridine1911/1915/1917 synthase
MAAIGHPLVGDPLYGGRNRGPGSGAGERATAAIAAFPRQALHAAALRFRHPARGAVLEFTSELPSDFSNLAKDLELV